MESGKGDIEGTLTCDESCTLRHGRYDTCVRCGQQWVNHSGHRCPKTGERGSWTISQQQLEAEHQKAMRRGNPQPHSPVQNMFCCTGCAVIFILIFLFSIGFGVLFFSSRKLKQSD